MIYQRPVEFLRHANEMGQIVPLVKDNVSPDCGGALLHKARMSEWPSEERFNRELCERVAVLRAARGWTQAEMAKALHVPFERYKKYESRSPLPSYLLAAFAQMTDRDVAYVLTGTPGKRSGPVQQEPPSPKALLEMLAAAHDELPDGTSFADYPQAVASSLHAQLRRYAGIVPNAPAEPLAPSQGPAEAERLPPATTKSVRVERRKQ